MANYSLFICFLSKAFPTSNLKICQSCLGILLLIWFLPIFAIPIKQTPKKSKATGSESKMSALLPKIKMAIRIIIKIIDFIFGRMWFLKIFERSYEFQLELRYPLIALYKLKQ